MRPQRGTKYTIRILGACVFLWLIVVLFPGFKNSSAQTGEAQPQASPLPSPSPSPSPSPTPITGLHQWGAVTLFHGLPSDRVHAIAQTPDGAMWFGTDTGLARFDGRRTQTINDPALPTGRILALQTDKHGAMWIGTEAGAARFNAGEFIKINETASQPIAGIFIAESGAALMTSEQGRVFECRARVEKTVRGALDSAKWLMLCGSLPPGVPAAFYGKLIAIARLKSSNARSRLPCS